MAETKTEAKAETKHEAPAPKPEPAALTVPKPATPAPAAKQPDDGLDAKAIAALFPVAYLDASGGFEQAWVVKGCNRFHPGELNGKPVATGAKRIRNGFRVKTQTGRVLSYNSDAKGEITRETAMPFVRGVDSGFPGVGARFLKYDPAKGVEFWLEERRGEMPKRFDVDVRSGKVL